MLQTYQLTVIRKVINMIFIFKFIVLGQAPTYEESWFSFGVAYFRTATVCDMHRCGLYKTAVELSVKLIFDSETNDVVDLGTLEFQVVDKLTSSETII
jgi:hypothetical protein